MYKILELKRIISKSLEVSRHNQIFKYMLVLDNRKINTIWNLKYKRVYISTIHTYIQNENAFLVLREKNKVSDKKFPEKGLER